MVRLTDIHVMCIREMVFTSQQQYFSLLSKKLDLQKGIAL
jgi:hypothetical protein